MENGGVPVGLPLRPSEKGIRSRIAGKSAIHSRLALRNDFAELKRRHVAWHS